MAHKKTDCEDERSVALAGRSELILCIRVAYAVCMILTEHQSLMIRDDIHPFSLYPHRGRASEVIPVESYRARWPEGCLQILG